MKALTAAKAILTAGKVPQEIIDSRISVCLQCDKMIVKRSKHFCGICGCCLSNKTRVFNLAAYVENLPQHGCKHPRRGQTRADGSQIGWA